MRGLATIDGLVEQIWLSTLPESHNNAESTFHLKMFDIIMIGKDLNPSDDIVYMNMTSLWHICNWLRAIDAGWIIQSNGNTFKVNRRGVAALTLGVRSGACQQSFVLGPHSRNNKR